MNKKASVIDDFIKDRLKELGPAISYDDFSELALIVGKQFNMNAQQASKAINDNLADREVGSQEYATHGVGREQSPHGVWQGQNEVSNFSKTDPGELAEPMAKLAFKEGTVVRVKENDQAPWGAEYVGVIIHVNEDGTYDVLDSNKQIQRNQNPKLFSNPLGEGRPTAPPQHSRVGDDYGMMDSGADIGDPEYSREHPGLFHKPRGHETDNVVNPRSPYMHKDAEKIEKAKERCNECKRDIKKGGGRFRLGKHILCNDCYSLEKVKTLYSHLRKKIVLEYGKKAAEAADAYLEGRATLPIELRTVLSNYGLKLV